jgi:hypothetical protein
MAWAYLEEEDTGAERRRPVGTFTLALSDD